MNKNQSSNKNCENCLCKLTTKYGSGRFCSSKCARGFSTKSKRAEISKKVSSTMAGRPSNNLSLREVGLLGAMKNRENKLNRFVKVNGDTLDITYRELEEYRKKQLVCEICLLPENSSSKGIVGVPDRLTVDHCHKTLKFRGLLCRACNYRLGWYENKKEGIMRYMVL